MTAKQLRYFGKRRKRVYAVSVPKKRRYVSMARRYRGRSRGGRGRGMLGGMKTMIAPVLGGVADSYLDNMPGIPVDGIGSTAVGVFMKSPVIRDIGLYKIGFSLGNILPLPGKSGSSSGGLL